MAYIHRTLEPQLVRAATEFPAVVLTGPRQSGKTTLLRHLFSETHEHVSLEPPDVREVAQADPRGFLARYRPPVIYDEVQYAPDLLAYVKEEIDERRHDPGQYLLTGSQNLLLMSRVTESLAGRAAILRLLPLSMREVAGQPHRPLPWEHGEDAGHRPDVLPPSDLWQSIVRGGYPELATTPGRDLSLWHGSYVQTYLERDVRVLRQVGDLTSFQVFLRALAARNAQLLNMAELSRDLGIALNTVKAWISVLEATHQITIVRPYHANVSKRLVKTPKVYFTDTGTLCYLVGLRDPAHAEAGPMGGALLETAVLSELLKVSGRSGTPAPISFWRTAAGIEVDFVVEHAGKLVPLEVKLTSTPRRKQAASLESLRQDMGELVAPGYVVHPGESELPLGAQTTALPITSL